MQKYQSANISIKIDIFLKKSLISIFINEKFAIQIFDFILLILNTSECSLFTYMCNRKRYLLILKIGEQQENYANKVEKRISIINK